MITFHFEVAHYFKILILQCHYVVNILCCSRNRTKNMCLCNTNNDSMVLSFCNMWAYFYKKKIHHLDIYLGKTEI